MNFNIPDLGIIDDSSGFRILSATTDGRFISGKEGVNIYYVQETERLNL